MPKLYKFRRAVVDNDSHKVIGYIMRDTKIGSFIKLRDNDVLKLINRGSVEGVNYSKVSGNMSVYGFDLSLIPMEYHVMDKVRITFERVEVDTGNGNNGVYIGKSHCDFSLDDTIGIGRCIEDFYSGIPMGKENHPDGARLNSYINHIRYNVENHRGFIGTFKTSNKSGLEYIILTVSAIRPSDVIGNRADINKLESSLSERGICPTTIDIELAYNYLNDEYYMGGFSSSTELYWSNRMTDSAGICRIGKRNSTISNIVSAKIGVSTHYHKRFSGEVVSTVAHEMIHLLPNSKSHDNMFKANMVRVNEMGIDVSIHSKGSAKVAYVYTCVKCGNEYERSRRMSTGHCCGICRGRLEEVKV